jgi:HlyD family secretion protein
LNNLEIQENSLKEAQNELALLQKGASSNIKNQYEAQIASMTYEIQKLEDTKNDYIIKAPTDGKILDVYIKESAFLQPGTKVIEIGNINRLYVEADILATDVGNVAKDQKAIVTSDDIDIGELKGVVSKVYPKAFSKLSDLGIEQKRVKVDVDLNNISSKLKAGYDVTTKIVTNEKNNVLQIPKNSVFQMENKNYVFVVENSKVKLRQIKTGIEGDDNIEVISGLKEGEKVIISPDKDIKEGIKVSIKK